MHQLLHGLCEADRMHGNGHSVCEGKDEADGAAQLRTQTAGDQEVRPTCATDRHRALTGELLQFNTFKCKEDILIYVTQTDRWHLVEYYCSLTHLKVKSMS